MKRSKLIIGLLVSILAMAFMAPFYASVFDVSIQDAFLGSVAVSASLTALHVVGTMITGRLPYTKGVAMDVAVEMWQSIIMENLFSDNEFLKRSHAVGSEYILGNKVVHIPQAGSKPTIVKNRSSFPAAAVRRTDSDVTYALDWFTSDPTHIPDIEQAEISYDKMLSVIREKGLTLEDLFSDELLYKWATGLASASIVRTSGAADAAHNPHATAVGTRNKFTKEDVKKARFLLNKQKIKGKRSLLLPAEFYDQLMDDSTLQNRDFGQELDMRGGVIVRLYGFDIIERDHVLMADNAGTPAIKAVGAADATTDNLTAIAWVHDAVERAVGEVKFYEDKASPTYYGDVFASGVRVGGRRRRTNDEGVVTIIQDGTYV